MNSDFKEVPLAWRAQVLKQINYWWLNEADPDETFSQWVDEAGIGSEAYIRYAHYVNALARHLNAFELEEQIALADEVLEELRHSGK